MDELFIAGTEPKTSNVTFTKARVGGDGSCLAASYTPSDQAREQTFVTYPPEFRAWAIDAGIPQPPTTFCPPPQTNPDAAIALLAQPAASSAITATQVFVRGTARGPYTLEYGAGRDPRDWQPITSGGVLSGPGVADGILGIWRTNGLVPGEYTLRLRVQTPDGAPVEVKTVVRVGQ
jgi:hypothetical protein